MSRASRRARFVLALSSILAASVPIAWAQGPMGTAFTYQGRLTDGVGPANANYDLRFQLFSVPSGGTAVATALESSGVNPVGVSDGLFTARLDFGAVFTGSKLWLEIGVKPAGSAAAYTVLAPRQELTPAPNALYSGNAGTIGGIACALNQIPKWNGSAWACSADNDTNSGGTVTAVTASAPLSSSGGAIPNIALAGGATGQILASPGGVATWTASPSLSGNLVLEVSTATTGNILKGANRFIHNFGFANTFIGENAGNFTMTGNSNTASGFEALWNNTTGGANTASGLYALLSNTTGSGNIAIGSTAGINLTTGDNNIAIGNPGVAGESNIIRIGAAQTDTFLAGIIHGDGSGLTGLSAANVTGVVPIANGGTGSATKNFVDLTTNQTVAGIKTFSSPIAGSVTGSAASVTGVVPIANGGTGSATKNFVDLTTNQTVAGIKTFSSPIAGSVTGSAASVTGVVPIANGGTGSATQNFVDLTSAQTVGGNKTLTGNLVLGTSTLTTGNIMKGASPFIHNFGAFNTFVGENAGNFTGSGTNNTAIGRNALSSNTTGVANTASGEVALEKNTSGTSNTAVGRSALWNNTEGSRNTATGRNALMSNETGSDSTAIGANALQSSPGSVNNTAVGSGALQFNMSGANNTASGVNALFVNTTGSGNIALGIGAGSNLTTGDNNIDIGNPGVAGESNIIRIGNAQTDTFLAGIIHGNGSGLTGVSAASVSGVVPISNGGTGSSSQNFVDLTSSQTVGGDKTLTGNLVLGASTATTGNIIKEGFRFIHSFGHLNTFIGRNAGNLAMTGNQNTASGVTALLSNTTGSNNTAAGLAALSSNTTGSSNTAAGLGALSTNTTGSGNTAIGYLANVSSGALTNAMALGSSSYVDASNKIRLGNTLVTVIEGQVAYTFTSDRNAKENLREVDAQAVLEKLRGLNVPSWNYIGHDPKEFRHYGPMAQDFHAAFGRDEVGTIGTETTINSGDITGILMIALKALDAQVQEDRRTISALAARIAELEAQAARVAEDGGATKQR